MACPLDMATLRADTGTDRESLEDFDIEEIWTQVVTLYPDGGDSVHYAAARVFVLRRRLAYWAEKASYTQNQESESLSDIFKNLQALLSYWQMRLKDALGESAGVHPPPSGTVRLRPVF